MTNFPDTPVGAQAAWVLDVIRTGTITEADVREHFHEHMLTMVSAPALVALLSGLRTQLGAVELVAVDADSPEHVLAKFASPSGPGLVLDCLVAPTPPHLIVFANLEPSPPTTTATRSWDEIAGVGQSAEPDWIDSKLWDTRAQLRLGGLVFGVVEDGKLVDVRSGGVRDLADLSAIDEDTVVRIGSISKTFTATGVMQLVEAGRIGLDDPVNDHLRAYRLEGSSAPVTVRHLLTHRGGITPGSAAIGVPEGQPVPTLAEFIGPTLEVIREPGTVWEYSNLGFATLGQLIADVTGVSFEQYMIDHVFDPLGMANTDFIRSSRVTGALAIGCAAAFGEVGLVPYQDIIVRPAGSVFSTLTDMTKWVAAVMNGGANDHGRVLDETTFSSMVAAQFELPSGAGGMGLGFIALDLDGHRIAFHNGGWPGAASSMWVAPDDKLGVLLFSNTFAARNAGAIDQAVAAILGHLLTERA